MTYNFEEISEFDKQIIEADQPERLKLYYGNRKVDNDQLL